MDDINIQAIMMTLSLQHVDDCTLLTLNSDNVWITQAVCTVHIAEQSSILSLADAITGKVIFQPPENLVIVQESFCCLLAYPQVQRQLDVLLIFANDEACNVAVEKFMTHINPSPIEAEVIREIMFFQRVLFRVINMRANWELWFIIGADLLSLMNLEKKKRYLEFFEKSKNEVSSKDVVIIQKFLNQLSTSYRR